MLILENMINDSYTVNCREQIARWMCVKQLPCLILLELKYFGARGGRTTLLTLRILNKGPSTILYNFLPFLIQ